jgi:hypothetical protein
MTMKKVRYTLLICLLTTAGQLIQIKATAQGGEQHTVSLGINAPLGEFAETHIAGIGSHYSWSHHRFGKLPALPRKLIGFTAHGGIDYYIGKKVKVSGYDFKYGGYLCLHVFGGLIYNPTKKENITLTTGPAMGIYKGTADAGFGAAFTISSYITYKIAITPILMYMKHDNTNALWVASVRATYIF